MIDKHDNKKQDIETEISRGSSIFLIFFLIYINKVFNKILETSSLVMSLSFIDDLEFIISGNLVKKVEKFLKEVAYTILE